MRNVTDFKDQVVVITGAAGGLGEALCRCFGKMGAKIAALDIDQNGLKTLQTILSDERIICKPYTCDAAQQIVDALLAGERQLMLGENAQLSWDVYHQDPLLFEKLMMESNRYILEQ